MGGRMKISRIVYILMPVSIYMAFLYAPPAAILGDASRIIYFHVPLAWGSALAFIYSGIVSIIYLLDKNSRFQMMEDKAYNSAHVGIVFTILAIISGSIWAKISWGSYWNWDPRQTSITVLILIYIAYFSLWSALSGNSNRGRICSAYLIFAMVTVPFFIFIIPRMYPTLHPDPIINPERKMKLDYSMRITLLTAVVSFTFLYTYLLSIRNKLSLVNNMFKEKFDEK
jgi:heme exporter protein C